MEYTHYEYKMIERRIAGAIARRIGAKLNDSQRNTLCQADQELRAAQQRMNDVTNEVVEEVMSTTVSRNSSFVR